MQNYAQVVKAVAPVPVWITTSQPRNTDATHRKKLMELKKRIEETYGPKAIDFWTGLANSDGTIKPEYNADRTHVNAKGHELLFNKVIAS